MSFRDEEKEERKKGSQSRRGLDSTGLVWGRKKRWTGQGSNPTSYCLSSPSASRSPLLWSRASSVQRACGPGSQRPCILPSFPLFCLFPLLRILASSSFLTLLAPVFFWAVSGGQEGRDIKQSRNQSIDQLLSLRRALALTRSATRLIARLIVTRDTMISYPLFRSLLSYQCATLPCLPGLTMRMLAPYRLMPCCS